MELRRLAGSVVMVGFRGLTAKLGSDIHRHIRENHLAGVILFDEHVPTGEHDRNIASPEQLRGLTAELQAASDPLLLIAIDQEGGQVARLNVQNGFPQFPAHAEMGEKFEPAETQLTASHIAKALAEAGVNVNFAPVVDLNINPRNPIIGAQGRSFSEDPAVVTDHARSFIAGHREHRVVTAIKHFPGHGSSTTDTHLSAVDVTESFKDSELMPYRCLINEGVVDMVMVGHLLHRGFDPELPASLSAKMIDGMLRLEMGFDGVVVTDCLDMAAAAEHCSLQKRVTLALNAGVDLLLFGNNLVYDPDRPTQVVDAVVAAVRAADVTEECLRQHVDRINCLRKSVASSE
ncbi:MAG: glycoside hydrolase family 3 [Planctomycetota bacterium]|nr:glycoside hydrolase family 3 [Planctomycetota bacterium]